MTRRVSGHFSTFGLVFFVLKSLLGIARQWSERFAILTLKPRSHARILIYRTWAIANLETVRGTDSGLRRIAVWGCFEDAISSVTGFHKLALETCSTFVPPVVP